MILEHVVGKRPQADRLLVAGLSSEAKHHARWRGLSGGEEAAAVAALGELAAERVGLLAEVAGLLAARSVAARVAETREAVRIYNDLTDGTQVARLFHSTF